MIIEIDTHKIVEIKSKKKKIPCKVALIRDNIQK
jgi:hypothetical protein